MRKWVIIILLIFSLLYSITGCGEKKEEKEGFVAEIGFSDMDLAILSEEFVETAANYQLEGLWKEVIIPEIFGLDELNYLAYVDCNETHLLPRLKKNIVYGIAEDTKQRGMELSELGVLKVQRVVFWDEIYHVFLKSDKGNEIYMLLRERGEDLPMFYVIVVDFWMDGSAETSIWDGENGYNSILEWDSYIRLDEATVSRCKLEVIDADHLYDSHYRESVYYALYNYYEKNGLDKEVTYIMDSNLLYVGQLGVILDIFLRNGEEEIALLVDTWNEKYTVLQ